MTAGVRTGLFVSPHLSSFRERIQVNGEIISESDFIFSLKAVCDMCIHLLIPASEFELIFLMAAIYFREKGCGAVVLEVGLGGENDATNVVTTAISVICSVCKAELYTYFDLPRIHLLIVLLNASALDHTRILGPTIEAICEKKAGIFKSNTPAIIGPGVPLEVAKVRLCGHSISNWIHITFFL